LLFFSASVSQRSICLVGIAVDAYTQRARPLRDSRRYLCCRRHCCCCCCGLIRPTPRRWGLLAANLLPKQRRRLIRGDARRAATARADHLGGVLRARRTKRPTNVPYDHKDLIPVRARRRRLQPPIIRVILRPLKYGPGSRARSTRRTTMRGLSAGAGLVSLS